MTIKILNQQEKYDVEKKLSEQFGIEKISGMIVMHGQERLFLFSGSLSEREIKKLENLVPIERIGIYFAKFINNELKLSLDGTQVFKEQINKNIIEINETQMKEWMSGSDLLVNSGKHGFVVIKYKDEFLGCGKASEQKIRNFVPKTRRIKNK